MYSALLDFFYWRSQKNSRFNIKLHSLIGILKKYDLYLLKSLKTVMKIIFHFRPLFSYHEILFLGKSKEKVIRSVLL